MRLCPSVSRFHVRALNVGPVRFWKQETEKTTPKKGKGKVATPKKRHRKEREEDDDDDDSDENEESESEEEEKPKKKKKKARSPSQLVQVGGNALWISLCCGACVPVVVRLSECGPV